jgi:hypothetical protein
VSVSVDVRPSVPGAGNLSHWVAEPNVSASLEWSCRDIASEHPADGVAVVIRTEPRRDIRDAWLHDEVDL